MNPDQRKLQNTTNKIPSKPRRGLVLDAYAGVKFKPPQGLWTGLRCAVCRVPIENSGTSVGNKRHCKKHAQIGVWSRTRAHKQWEARTFTLERQKKSWRSEKVKQDAKEFREMMEEQKRKYEATQQKTRSEDSCQT